MSFVNVLLQLCLRGGHAGRRPGAGARRARHLVDADGAAPLLHQEARRQRRRIRRDRRHFLEWHGE